MPDLEAVVLGATGVLVDGTRADIGGRRPTVALSVLLAARGRLVTTDSLVDAIWPDDPPESAVGTLQAYLSRLRKALDPDKLGVILRDGDGYRLPSGVVKLDAEHFEDEYAAAVRAAEADDPAEALRLLDRGLARWQGPAYAGLTGSAVIEAEAQRLDELHELARVERLAALVDLGSGGDVLADLHAFTAAHPSHERGWELLALALYREGRQPDALEALRSAREVLVDSYGLDPGPRLAQLEAAILDQDQTLLTAARADRPGAQPVTRMTLGQSFVPTPMTGFVGRAADLAEVSDRLSRNRLVTLSAIGGTGKTRLAIAVAAARVDDAGPWFVDLAAVADPSYVPAVVATCLGLLPDGGIDAVIAAVGDQQALIVLDNCEHLVDAAAEVAEDLLAGCPGLRLLATSRIALGLAGEAVIDLGPMAATEDAVELFEQRAGAVTDWAPDEADLAAVARICTELDGLPLAVELAASHCRFLTPQQIADQLGDRFALLAAIPRQRSGSERSLAAAVAWSVEQLSAEARDLFCRLAVFAGGFDMPAVVAVAGSNPVQHLVELVDAGLVSVDRTSAVRRYRMLETLREYARRITEPDLLASAVRGHRDWLLGVVAEAEAAIRGPDTARWIERLELEMPNARAALSASIAGEDGVGARRITADLSWFWFRRAYVAEGIRWSTQSLALPAGLPGDVDDRQAIARTHLGLGLLNYLAGNHEVLLENGRLALIAAQKARDEQTTAIAHSYEAYRHAYGGDIEAAIASLGAAEQTATTHGPEWVVADTLMIKGQLLRAAGDHDGAMAALDDAGRRADACGHSWAHESALWIGAKVALDIDRPDIAASRTRQMVENLLDQSDLTSWLVGLHVLAGAVASLGQPEVGAKLLGAVAATGARIGFSPEAMDPLDGPRNVALVRDRLDPADFKRLSAEGAQLSEPAIMALVRSVEVALPTGVPHAGG